MSTDHLLAAVPRGFAGVVEGWVLPEPVSRALADGRAADVPLLLGATANEWGVMALSFPPPKDLEAYRRLLRETGPDDSRTERLFARYPRPPRG